MSWIAAAGLAVSGGISIAKGISQKNQAKKLQNTNAFPDQKIPNSILANQEMAKQQATQGLPSEVYQNSIKNIDRGTNTALSMATNRRGGLGLIGGIQRNANDAKGNLGVADANARSQNQQNLYGVNNQVGQWENNVWDWNKRQKYLQTASSVRALMGAGDQNLYGGIDRLASGGLMAGGSLLKGGGGGVSAVDTASTGGLRTPGTFGSTVNSPKSNLTGMPNTPTTLGGNNNTFNQLMGGGRPLGNSQIPSLGAGNTTPKRTPQDLSNYNWLGF